MILNLDKFKMNELQLPDVMAGECWELKSIFLKVAKVDKYSNKSIYDFCRSF